MPLHNTQCPHCFTTYVISDEQLRVSEGMVRCGTCRERFQARLLDRQIKTPRFDPREAFIEPLTDELDAQKKAEAKALMDETPQRYSFADPHTESERSTSISLSDVSESVNSDMSLDIDDEVPSPPLDSKRLTAEQMLANIKAKQQREREAQKATLTNETEASNTRTQNVEVGRPKAQDIGTQGAKTLDTRTTNRKTVQQELSLPNSKNIDPASISEPTVGNTVNKETLIDQVDSLVDDKLGSAKDNTQAANTQNDIEEVPFQLDRKPKKKLGSRFSWLLVPPMLVIVLLLGATLVYQLWMKQIVTFSSNSFAQKKITELSIPVAKKLAEHNIVLPLRRNLSQLELASARTEAHPSRSSTTLLRISIINHADIEQPLPWLEMSLTDSEGKLVSRRNLSPHDYVYQNATNDLIGARELKKITIELLSFPKQATGYELKILSK